MVPQFHSLTAHFLPSFLPTTHFAKPSAALSIPINRVHSYPSKANKMRRSLIQPLRCLASVASEATHLEFALHSKPSPAEVSRTIMELSSVGTLSSLTQEGWPMGIGVRFAVDPEGTPVLCLNAPNEKCFVDRKSSLYVQLEQRGLWNQQCVIQGFLDRPEDILILEKLQSMWKKRFGEDVDGDLLYAVAVEQVLQIDDYMEDGIWVTSADYKVANPDPLRDFAVKFVNERNTGNMEDIHRFCSVYVDLDFKVREAKMIWVDRLGFDMRVISPENDVFEVRIPFPREVNDEKGAKSSFNCMSQDAWEVEKNCRVPDFKKVKQLKKISSR